MSWQWNGKDMNWLLALSFLLAVAAIIMGILFPFAHKHPVMFWTLVVALFIAGFVVVCKRAGKK